MSVIESLKSGAKADVDVIYKLKQHGDDDTMLRDVDFVFLTTEVNKANALIQFVNDQHYGAARVESSGTQHRVLVKISMSIQQHVILSVSGFMACLAALFDLQYDGWGCPLTRPVTRH